MVLPLIVLLAQAALEGLIETTAVAPLQIPPAHVLVRRFFVQT